MTHGALERLLDSDQVVEGTGRPTLRLQRIWQEIVEHLEQAEEDIEGKQAAITADTGWAADTGTAKKTANATYSAPTISNPPTQAEVQAIANALQNASQTVKALKDMLIAQGLATS